MTVVDSRRMLSPLPFPSEIGDPDWQDWANQLVGVLQPFVDRFSTVDADSADFDTDFALKNIQELANVAATSPSVNDVLSWNGSNWVDKTVDEITEKWLTIQVVDAGSSLTTGNDKYRFFVPSQFNNHDLTSIEGGVFTASSSGAPSVQIHNLTDGADMLTTNLTVDQSETHSSTATTPAVIDTANDDVVTGDMLRVDVDAAGTGTQGLELRLGFTPQ